MRLFKKKKADPIDDRTNIERSFEETGQQLGKKAGELTQKGVDKVNDLKVKLEEDGTMDKIRNFGDKVEETAQGVVDKIKGKSKANKDE